MYGQSSSWYKPYQCLHNLSPMDLFLSFPFIPLLHSPPLPVTKHFSYLGSSIKSKEQLKSVTIYPIHVYSHSYNSFLLTKKQYKGMVRGNWKMKVRF